MWTEIVLSREDLARLLTQAFPLTIRLGDAESDNSLALSDLGDVRLVPELGLRIECKARVRWPVLGIELPVALKALTLMLVPSVGQGPHGDTLVFRIAIEHADFTGVPDIIDQRITKAINTKLESKDAELCWDLSKTLTLSAQLPELLEELDVFAMRPKWAKVRVTGEAVVYAASFHSAFVRRGQPVPSELTLAADAEMPDLPIPIDGPRRPRSIIRQRSKGSPLAAAGMFGLGAGAAYFALRALARSS
jgi:hypothetical protein